MCPALRMRPISAAALKLAQGVHRVVLPQVRLRLARDLRITGGSAATVGWARYAAGAEFPGRGHGGLWAICFQVRLADIVVPSPIQEERDGTAREHYLAWRDRSKAQQGIL